MTEIPTSGMASDGKTLGTVAAGTRGSTGRLLAWVVGGILGVIGAVTTVTDLLHHHHGIGPFLLAAAFLSGLLAALDMWRIERSRVRATTRSVRRLGARLERQEEDVRHLEHDRDEWRLMQAEEASINRRLTEELQRAQRPPRVSGGTVGVASTGPPPLPLTAPPGPAPIRRPPPRHSRRRPPDNQPPLFDQDDDRWA